LGNPASGVDVRSHFEALSAVSVVRAIGLAGQNGCQPSKSDRSSRLAVNWC